MPFKATSPGDLISHDFDTLIDVRAPSEFAEDHIPGAINLPVLTDEERARVGTVYVQESPFLARKIGAALVARNAARHIEGPLAENGGGWRPLVYCWRGGQRSGSFAAILGQIGWRVEVLEGGYRSWRRLVKSALYDGPFTHKLVLLDGNTGTAKTDLLARLEARGAQVIDLEGLAAHRGSALGALGAQPSQKAFESGIAARLARFDPSQPVLVEAESSKIGRINVPPAFFTAMKRAPRIEVSASVSARAEFLVEAYADMSSDVADRETRLDRLIALQGRDVVEHWKSLASQGAFKDLATELITQHYDPRYAKARARVGSEFLAVHHAEKLDEAGREALADRVAETLSGL
jgi:tRNA 2-selenouridine synthase